jgi:hypothetical protein
LDDTLMTMLKGLERDGFKIKRNVFVQPANAVSLDRVSKRRLTICNLFVNHELSIDAIVRVLDEDYGRVVVVLIEQGLLHERRKTRREPAQPRRAPLRKY